MRALWLAPDRKAQREPLRKLAQEADAENWPTQSLLLLADALLDSGDPDSAAHLLYRVQAAHSGDVWVNYNLGQMLEKLSRRDEAIRFYTAARAIRPETAHELAHALAARGQSDEAIAVFRDLTRLRSGDTRHLTCLGDALGRKGPSNESSLILETASVAGREWIRLKPRSISAHLDLGRALRLQGKLDEAADEFRSAIRLNNDCTARFNLGRVLQNQGKPEGAIAEYRAVIRHHPDFADAHFYLGIVLCDDKHEYTAAEGEFREAIRLRPDDADSHQNLGLCLHHQRDFDAAITEFRAALRIDPNYAASHHALGDALDAQGKKDEAIAEFRWAIRLEPNDHLQHFHLGTALANQGKFDEAITELRTTVRVKPDYAEAFCNLGKCLLEKGDYAEALQMLRKGHELGSRMADWHYPSASWVAEAEQALALSKRLRAVLEGKEKPRDNPDRLALARMAFLQMKFACAATLWAEALKNDPKIVDDRQAQHRYNAACAAALAAAEQGRDEPVLDEPTKRRWHKQALDWLKTDMALWTKQVENGVLQSRQAVAQTLQHWKEDPDLVSIRDPASLAKLPEPERMACQALWAEVDALLAKARAGAKP
jgi:tetratricopeptide (TPR) repeat protein